MKRLLDRELVRWALPAGVLLVVFVLYTSVASIVLVASGGPAAMAAAADGDIVGDGDDDVNPGAADVGDPAVTESPVPEPAPVTDPRLPATCGELFSPGVVAAANEAGLVLNPPWADGTDPGGLMLQDPELAATLASVPALDCRWLSPNGGSGVGIRSVIAVVSADQAAALNARFAGLGYRPQSELGGTRYFFEASADGTPYGESHIVRDDIWFATHWLAYGPRGYTADMVTNYFG